MSGTNSKGINLVAKDVDSGKQVEVTSKAGGLQVTGLVSGQIEIITGHGKAIENPASDTISTATTTEVIAAGGSGVYTYVFAYKLTSISAVLNTVVLKHGTTQVDTVDLQSVGDATCGINPSVEPDAWIFKSNANEAINIITSTAEDMDFQICYWQDTE